MRRSLALCVCLLVLVPNAVLAQPSQDRALAVPLARVNCRFGITVNSTAFLSKLPDLGVGGFLSWSLVPPNQAPAGVDFVHVVRLRDSQRQFVYESPEASRTNKFESTLQAAVLRYPGQAWLVGNEPDTTFEGQDSLTPDQYAQAYHNVYRLIKKVDPTAQIAIGTIVQPTPLRMQWLDAMWAAYRTRYQVRPPADLWSIHSFILREKADDWGTGIPTGLSATVGELYSLEQTDNLEIFSKRLVDFRQWMADHGDRDKPLWITEYGSLLPHDGRNGLVTQSPERARDYMLATFKFLSEAADPQLGNPADGNHLVQRWFWYSLDDNLWRFGGSLYDPDSRQRTVIGDAFVDYVHATEPHPALQLGLPTGGPLGSWPRRHTDSVLVRVLVSNLGNTATQQPFRIRWYAGNPADDGKLLQSSTLNKSLAGCGSGQMLSAWLPFPKPDELLYVQLDSPELAQPMTLPLTILGVRPSPP